MKKIILITVITILCISCLPCKKVAISPKVYMDLLKPSIDSSYGGYYVTRCTCFPQEGSYGDKLIYPKTMKELEEVKKMGYECHQYSVPVELLNK